MKSSTKSKSGPNKLVLEHIRQRIRIGCTPEERSWPQLCCFNIELHFDMSTCAVSDDLNHTIDYMKVLALLEQLAAEHEWRLIESMSASICSHLLERFQILERVNLSVRKEIAENTIGASCHYQLERPSL